MLVTPPPLPGPHSLVSMSLLVGLPHLCRREASGETLKSQNKVAVQTETVPGGQYPVCQPNCLRTGDSLKTPYL